MVRDLTKWIASMVTVRLHPGVIRAGARLHLALFRLFRGPRFLGADTLVLTTRGRRSGRPRSAPLYYVEEYGHLYIAASFGGSDEPPYWYGNLLADPAVTIDVGTTRLRCSARVLPDDEARSLWLLLLAVYPPYTRYQERTTRRIPVVELTRSLRRADGPHPTPCSGGRGRRPARRRRRLPRRRR